ncbi:hypothetical protein, partial [Prochlorococcus marinus]|uniref:hypothetical protein n=1 Tax=Prochlorococcus marinus TaxID=1219 RepID=UPI0015CF0B5D
ESQACANSQNQAIDENASDINTNLNSINAIQTLIGTNVGVDINSGAIDGTTIGANSASSGAFTTLSASGNSTVGGTLGV